MDSFFFITNKHLEPSNTLAYISCGEFKEKSKVSEGDIYLYGFLDVEEYDLYAELEIKIGSLEDLVENEIKTRTYKDSVDSSILNLLAVFNRCLIKLELAAQNVKE